MGFVWFAILMGVCIAQINLYKSEYDQTDYAHTIELSSNDCTTSQDMYAIFFWHRFSFTTPKYSGQISPMVLARLTLSPSYSDSSTYSDRVLYVESSGVSFTICSHDTTSENVNVCKVIDISSYRYDMEWIFMHLQYKPAGIVSIYINFLSQSVEIIDSLTSVLNTRVGSYMGLFLGGRNYLSTALNGWFYHPNILIGNDSQIQSKSALTRIFQEQPPNDYIKDQFISFQGTTSFAANGIYTRLGFYGTFILDSSVGSTSTTILSVNGVDGIAGVVGSTMIKLAISNDKLVFSSDNYVELTSSSDDLLDSFIVEYPIALSSKYFYYVDVNMESGNIVINCTGLSDSQTFSDRKNFIPSKLIFSRDSKSLFIGLCSYCSCLLIASFLLQTGFSNGRYLESNFLGASYGSNSTEYQMTLTQGQSDPLPILTGLTTSIKKFSLCFWWRLSSLFPQITSQTSNSVNLQTIPLISLNTGSAPVTDCSETSNFLACGYLNNYQMTYMAYQNSTAIQSADFTTASSEWVWGSTCLTYKSQTDSTSSITKAYQYVASTYQEVSLLSQNLVLSSITDLYLQLSFSGDMINKQFYNIRLTTNTDNYSYLDELQSFNVFTINSPYSRSDTSMYVANILPGQGTLSSSLSYSINGFQYVQEYSVTLWSQMSSGIADSTILTAYINSGYNYIGKMFIVTYVSSTSTMNLLTYSKQRVSVSDTSSTQVTIALSLSSCDLTQYFFIYVGYSNLLYQAKLGVICNVSGVMTRLTALATVYQLSIYSFNLVIDPQLYAGTIAQVTGNFGLSAYESKNFTEISLGGKWECAYKTFTCSQPQIDTTDYSTQCKSTYSYDAVAQQCLDQCPCGYFADSTNPNVAYTCTLCNIAAVECLQCIDNSDSGQCTFCADGLSIVPPSGYFSADVQKGECQCEQSGYAYDVAGSCVICQAPCVECSGSATSCTKCSTLAYLSGTECKCIDGYFMDTDGVCQPCGEYCLTCEDSSTQCLSCYGNQFRVINATTNTCDCGENYAEITNTSSSKLECVYCDPNQAYYLSSATTCDPCNGNCQTCKNTDTTCLTCDDTLRRELNTATSTCDCVAGYYSPGSSLQCLQCPDSCEECSSTTYCTVCTSERILQASGAIQECVCDRNQYFYTNSAGDCEIVTLTASLSDYYSTTTTSTIYFSIVFSEAVSQYQQIPSTLIDGILIDGLPNTIDPLFAVASPTNQRRFLNSNSDQSFVVRMNWENDSTIFVKVEFFRSFMQKYLVINLKGNQAITSSASASNFLYTQSLSLYINLVIYTQDETESFLSRLISSSISLSNPTNGFTQFLMFLTRDCYLLLLIFPFLQMILVILSLSTILPTNFFHFIRMFSHLFILRNTAMQEENSQLESISYIFLGVSKTPSLFRDLMEDNFKRLNFTNSYVVMACSPTLIILAFHVIYLSLSQYYEYTLNSIVKKQDEASDDDFKDQIEQRPFFKRIKFAFICCNLAGSVILKNLLFLLIVAAIINIKSQYLLEYEQVFGYVMSFLSLWGFVTFMLNILSILSTRQHYEANKKYMIYDNFITEDTETTEMIDWDDSNTFEYNREMQDREMNLASRYCTRRITFKFVSDNRILLKPEENEPKENAVPLLLRIQQYRRFYHFTNVLRKVTMIIFLVTFSGQFQGQMVPVLVLQVIFILQIILQKPKIRFWMNILKIVAEISLLIVFVMLFISHKIQSDMSSYYKSSSIPQDYIAQFFSLGSAMIAFMSLYMVIHLVTGPVEIFYKAKKWLKLLKPDKRELSNCQNVEEFEEQMEIPEFQSQREFVNVTKIAPVLLELAPIQKQSNAPPLESFKYNRRSIDLQVSHELDLSFYNSTSKALFINDSKAKIESSLEKEEAEQ